MSEKKRKGGPEDGLSSTASVDPVAGFKKVKVVHVQPDEEFPLVIASAPGLKIPSKLQWQPYIKKTSGRESELLLHAEKLGRIDYTARESSVFNDESNLKHYVGIFDPDKNELELIEAKSMSIRSSIRSEEEEVRQERIAKMPQDRSQRHQLGLEFGTKKAKKAINSMTENAISTRKAPDVTVEDANKALKNDASATAVLDSMAKAAQNNPSKQAIEASVDASKPRPKLNLDAKAPIEVFSVSDMIDDDVLNQVKVKPWFDSVEAKEAIATESRFVTHRIPDIVHASEVKKLKVLRYMLLVMTFFKVCQPLKSGGRKLPPPKDLKAKTGIDELLLKAIKKKFTIAGEMTKWHVDLLITSLAALSLIIDDFQTDNFDLREDLGLKTAQMEKYFQELGARTSAMTETERIRANLTKNEALNHKVSKLRIPLKFPTEKRPLSRRPGR